MSRFRVAVTLAASAAILAATAAPAAPATPASTAPQALRELMAAQTTLDQIARDISAYADSEPEAGFAGVRVSPRSSSVTVYWRGTPPKSADSILRRRQDRAHITVEKVTYSRDQLAGAALRLVTRYPHGDVGNGLEKPTFRIVDLAPAPDFASLRITAVPLSIEEPRASRLSTGQLAAELVGTAAMPVSVIERGQGLRPLGRDGKAEPPATNADACQQEPLPPCPPDADQGCQLHDRGDRGGWKAGARWCSLSLDGLGPKDPTKEKFSTVDCTTGFSVQDTTTADTYVLTASHCVQDIAALGRLDRSRPIWSGNSRDVISEHYFQYVDDPKAPKAPPDLAFLKTDEPSSLVYFGWPHATRNTAVTIPVAGEASSWWGDYVCVSSSHSPTTCNNEVQMPSIATLFSGGWAAGFRTADCTETWADYRGPCIASDQHASGSPVFTLSSIQARVKAQPPQQQAVAVGLVTALKGDRSDCPRPVPAGEEPNCFSEVQYWDMNQYIGPDSKGFGSRLRIVTG